MKTAIITVKTEPELKRRAQKFARGTGMSLSDVVNMSLRQTVIRGSITIAKDNSDVDDLSPLQRSQINARLAKSEADFQAGRGFGPFETADQAIEFLRKEIKQRKKNKSSQ